MSKQQHLKLVPSTDLDLADNEGHMERLRPLADVGEVMEPVNEMPVAMEVPVADLYIDHSFQRDRSRQSARRVTQMLRNWDWRLFERPLLWKDGKDRLSIIDGQHTAIAWISHPHLPSTIPVFFLRDLKLIEEAAATFMGRNLNRVRPNNLQIFKSALTANMEWAVEVKRLVDDTKVRIPYTPEFQPVPNSTMSLVELQYMLEKYGYANAKRVLSILTEGALRPIREVHMKAVAHLLFSAEYRGMVSVEKLKAVLRSTNDNLALGQSIKDAVETKMKRWECLAVLYWRAYQDRFGS